MSNEKVTQTQTTQDQQDQTQQQEQQQDQQQTQQVDMKTYLELVAKIEKMAEKEQELFQKQVQLSLKEAGLEQFASIVKVSDEKELKDVIKKLTSIVNDLKIELGYVPSEHKQMSAYEQAKKQGNTKNMIKALFGMNN